MKTMRKWMMAGMILAASCLVAADGQNSGRRNSQSSRQGRGQQGGGGQSGGHDGGQQGGRMGNREEWMRSGSDSVINLDSEGWIDAAEKLKLEALLKKSIEEHNTKLLKEYDTNHNGIIDLDESQKIKEAIASAKASRRNQQGMRGGPSGQGGGNRGNGGGNGNRPPEPPDWDNGNGNGGERMGPPPGGRGGPGADEESSSSAATGALTVAGTTETHDSIVLVAKERDQSVVLAQNNAFATLTKVTFAKTGDASNEQSSNFSGLNAIVLVSGSGKVCIDGGTLSSDAKGANGLFATGSQATIEAHNLTIKTMKNSSRGLDATKKGTIIGDHLTIATEGAHCACLATDRGEGTVKVSETQGTTRGEGSPGIYSTGDISATKSRFEAFGSEAAVVEGKNSITLVDTEMIGHLKCGAMLYQSFSGDADTGTSVFKMTRGSLTAETGPLFKITNTRSEIFLDGVSLSNASGIFLSAKADRWGREGRNGGHVAVTMDNQKASGDVVADAISDVSLFLNPGTNFSGALNADNTAQSLALTIKSKASWSVSRDSFLSKLDFGGDDIEPSLNRIQSNGHTVVAANLTKSYPLPGGGTLVPAKK